MFLVGGYLTYLGLSHLFAKPEHSDAETQKSSDKFKVKELFGFFKSKGMIGLVFSMALNDLIFGAENIGGAVAITSNFQSQVIGIAIAKVAVVIAAPAILRIVDKHAFVGQGVFLYILTMGNKILLDSFQIIPELPEWASILILIAIIGISYLEVNFVRLISKINFEGFALSLTSFMTTASIAAAMAYVRFGLNFQVIADAAKHHG
jgi:predicted tellurium resistance membrane protein TerC